MKTRSPGNFLLFLIIPFTAACTTMQPMEENLTNEEILNEIQPGNEIRIVTKTGDQHLITVSSVSEEYIIGEEEQFKREDIESIEIKRLTAAGTAAGLGVGIGIGALEYALMMWILLGFAL